MLRQSAICGGDFDVPVCIQMCSLITEDFPPFFLVGGGGDESADKREGN